MPKSPFLTALERYQQRAGSGGALRQELSLKTELEDLVQIQEARQLARGADIEQFADVSGDIGDITKELQNLEQNRQQGASKALLSKLTTLSSQNEMSKRVNVASSRSGVYMQSLRKVQIPTARLESDYSSNMSQVAELSEELKGMAGGLGDPNTLAAYKRKVAEMTQLESSAALSKTTIRTQTQMGLDPRGIVTAAQTAAGRVGSAVGRFDVEAKARAGEFGSLGQESGKLADMFRTLQISLENYNEAQEGGTDAQEAAGRRLRSITEEMSQQEGVIGAIRGGAGAGRGAGAGFNMAGEIAKILSSVARTVTDTYEATQISQPLQIMENQTRMANVANRQYENVGNMMQGNQMAFLKTMQMDTFRRTMAEEMFGRMQLVKQGERVGDVLDTFGNAAIGIGKGLAVAGVGALTGVGAVPGLIAGGAIAAQGLSGLGTIFKSSMDIQKGISAGRLAADMAERSEGFFEALQGIPAKQMQSFEDYSRGTYAATTGFGVSRSNTTMRTLLDLSKGGFVDQAVQANISPIELLELTSLAGQTVGGRDFERKSIISAGRFEQAGLGSKRQYMSLVGQLSDIGGRDTNLEETLRKAVTVGMDDSKNIGRMVAATVALSETGAAQGLNVSQAMSEMLMQGVSGAAGGMLTVSQRTKMAASAAENLDKMYKMGGTDIFSLLEYQQFAELFPKASYEQLQSLEKSGTATVGMWRTLLTKDEKSTSYQQAKESLEISGYASLLKTLEGGMQMDKLEAAIGIKSRTVTGRAFGVAPSIGGEGVSKVARYVASGDPADWDALSVQEKEVARVQFKEKLGEFRTTAAMMRTGDPSGEKATIGPGDLRDSVFSKLRAKGIFDYNEMSAGNQRLNEVLGVKEKGISMPADISGLSFEEQEILRGTSFGEQLKQERKEIERNQRQTIILEQAAKFPEAARDDEKRQRDVAAGRAPEALSFEKQSKDFSDGVIVFEEGVKKFNALVKTMSEGAVDRDTTGSESKNAKVPYYSHRTGIGVPR